MLIRDALGQSIPLRILGNVCSRAINEAGVRCGVTLSAAHHALLTLALQDVNGVLNIMISTAASLPECRSVMDPLISLSLWSEIKRESIEFGQDSVLYKVCRSV